jgi:methylenetetrahydrofolate reductase (NADPH)
MIVLRKAHFNRNEKEKKFYRCKLLHGLNILAAYDSKGAVEMDFNKLNDRFSVSFEVFPPKTDEGEKNLFSELDTLIKYTPAFISVTYGAGGSTQEKTIDLALKIRNRYGIPPLVHFTCVGSGRKEIKEHLGRVKDLGLTDILALRGDPPRGQNDFVPCPDGFSFANELVEFIKSQSGFSIAVAGYPETHPACTDFASDVRNLKRKIDAGAQAVLTQFFFDNSDYFRLVDALAELGSKVPVIPGILPITNISQIEKFIAQCGAKVPQILKEKLDKAEFPEEVIEIGIQHSINQCIDLRNRGVKGFHLYPLNKAYAVSKILDAIEIGKA